MLCPYCGFDESNVLESRDAQEGKATRRRRECLKCQKRFTTYEKVGNIELRVVKKDGRVEDYSREKLERCFEKACWKLAREERTKLIDEMEMKLLNWPSVEIPSHEIGKMVMEKLKNVDPVAYIRFATIYLGIKNIEDFEKLIKDFPPNPRLKIIKVKNGRTK
ncbi:MAG: transcriptional regulator NrdR [Candidatus Shapirobacteria bacterium]|jgi:transcriptional repressor NrdR